MHDSFSEGGVFWGRTALFVLAITLLAYVAHLL